MVIMQIKNYNVALRVSTLFLLCFSLTTLAVYVEGIDTTDTNGYGLDSAFKIGGLNIRLSGQKLACYSGIGFSTTIGAFKYAFNEINLAADSIFFSSWLGAGYEFEFPRYNFCFVIQKYKDSTFYKVLILNRLEDKRYVFKFGTNTTPKNRVLMQSDYNRSIRYKPNNLFYFFKGSSEQGSNQFSWEPPLSSDNHLQGYIIYVQKNGAAIDTTASINLAQWDSVGFTDSTTLSYRYAPQGEYFNIVAVYTEGKSDFLKGWTRLMKFDDIKKHFNLDFSRSSISIKITGGNLSIMINQHGLPAQLSIFDVTGKRIASLRNIYSTRCYLNTTQKAIPPGLYLLRAEFPDRSTITQPFTITR
jgi:hypothetical protein